MANEKKYYTWMDIAEGKDGQKLITVELTLSRPDLRDLQEGKKVLSCSAAISNGEQRIGKALGTELKAQDGTLWVEVQFWNDIADRFQKFLNGREKIRAIICGRLSLRTWTAKDGSPAQRVQISASNWRALDKASPAASDGAATEAPAEPGMTVECPF